VRRAIDFQEGAEHYHSRVDTASLDELYDAAEKVLAGEPLSLAIGDALMHGTAIGGAHPSEQHRRYWSRLSVSMDGLDVHSGIETGGSNPRDGM